MKNFKFIFITILLFFSITTSADNGLIITRSDTIEQYRIEVFYNKTNNSGKLYARSTECSGCKPRVLPIDNTAKIFLNGEEVGFNTLLEWKNVIADVSYNRQDGHVVAVRRY